MFEPRRQISFDFIDESLPGDVARDIAPERRRQLELTPRRPGRKSAALAALVVIALLASGFARTIADDRSRPRTSQLASELRIPSARRGPYAGVVVRPRRPRERRRQRHLRRVSPRLRRSQPVKPAAAPAQRASPDPGPLCLRLASRRSPRSSSDDERRGQAAVASAARRTSATDRLHHGRGRAECPRPRAASARRAAAGERAKDRAAWRGSGRELAAGLLDRGASVRRARGPVVASVRRRSAATDRAFARQAAARDVDCHGRRPSDEARAPDRDRRCWCGVIADLPRRSDRARRQAPRLRCWSTGNRRSSANCARRVFARRAGGRRPRSP